MPVNNRNVSVGGATLYPYLGNGIDPSRTVFRPQRGDSGLLTDDQMGNLRRDFAGGLLNGYQVGATPDAQGRFFTPIAASDQYTVNPDDATPRVTEDPAPAGAGLTFRDALGFMYGDMMGVDPTRGAGGQLAQFVQTLARAGPRETNKNWQTTDFSLDDEWDPDNEMWKQIVGMAQGLAAGGGGNQA